MNEEQRIDEVIEAIRGELPPFVSVNWKKWGDVLTQVAPGTVANDCSKGVGPDETLYIGRYRSHPRESFLRYYRGKIRIAGVLHD